MGALIEPPEREDTWGGVSHLHLTIGLWGNVVEPRPKMDFMHI